MPASTEGKSTELELLFAGPLTNHESAQLEAADQTRALGNLPREETLALQQSSDSLLLIAGDHPGVATGKLYEYMAAKRPIMVLGENSAAAEIVRRLDCGLVASANDPHSIADAFTTLTTQASELNACAVDANVEDFSYEILAQRMAEEIECAIRKRRPE
jgi:glycosyltransferase involved in cell wall biosynthesis